MFKKLCIVFLSVILLSGCASTRKKHALEIEGLQERIVYLEEELDDKDKLAMSLQDQIEMMQQEVLASQEEQVSQEKEIVMKMPKLSTQQIQLALAAAGYYDYAVDNKMGSKTRAAIRAFQKDNGLKVDGKVGPKTWAVLKKYYKK